MGYVAFLFGLTVIFVLISGWCVSSPIFRKRIRAFFDRSKAVAPAHDERTNQESKPVPPTITATPDKQELTPKKVLVEDSLPKRVLPAQIRPPVVERPAAELLPKPVFVFDGPPAMFHHIEPGEFMMGEVGKQIPVSLTHPFEMMATPTNQVIYRALVKLALSVIGQKYELNPNPSCFKGDLNPVELVSYKDIQRWIEGLNELSSIGAPALLNMFSGHRTGDVYRLPTEAEWEFVVRGRGQLQDLYFFGNQDSQLGDYAWFAVNSGEQTHAVGQKNPLIIDDKHFFDMLGNVEEWVRDRYQDKLPGGTNPLGPSVGSAYVLRGGSWLDNASSLRSAHRRSLRPDLRNNQTGFRLVRTTRKA